MSGDAARCASGRRIAVLLEYDGTAYCGSQYQENGPSIQATLEAAINNLSREWSRAALAGRTDAGVHALGQVAAFDTASVLSMSEWVSGLNHFLPADIAVRDAREAARGFDPRRDARSRAYRYVLNCRPVRSPIERNRAWHIPKALDVEAMRGAADVLVGQHDFSAFTSGYDGLTRRTMRRCEVNACGRRIAIEMEAEAFLPHQVRRTVGPLVEVGLGRMTTDKFVGLLERAEPSSAGPAAPSCGLYLVRVRYDDLEFDLGNVNGQD